MKNKLINYLKIIFLVTLSSVSMNVVANSNVNIKEISDLNNIVEFTNNNTLVIFDLDKTLITSETDYGSADWFYCMIESE